MDEGTKFKLRVFLYYLIIEPWTEKISLPNFRTVNTILLCIALFFKWEIVIFVSIIVLIILQLINEYKSGKYIYWYRQRKYREQKDALKKVREERKEGVAGENEDEKDK